MKLRCLLVDDEPPALKLLESHINQTQGLGIVAQCKNALEAIEVLHSSDVDLIFLDIKMPKILGTDFLRSIQNPPLVIFTTAYREFAVDSYELDAVDYLLKPISFERFLKAVSKVRKFVESEPVTKVEEYAGNQHAFVYLKVDKYLQKIFINDILYVESWKDYVKVYTDTTNCILVKQSITAIQNLLSAYNFLRVHRSYLVSVKRISSFNSSTIQLGIKQIPIGRLYKQNVLKAIREY